MGEKYFSLDERVKILSEGTKYDSCNQAGVCHTFTPDGRCIQLYKTLMTNRCSGECLYCPNRCGREVTRTSLAPDEIIKITWDLYRKNSIEGLFLTSGVLKDPEYTSQKQLEIIRTLREQGFNGYIHVRLMPGVPRDVMNEISLYANKFGVNAETTCDSRYSEICPNFDYGIDVLRRMGWTNDLVKERRSEMAYGERIIGANDTQFVVGASCEPDKEIILTIDRFMENYGLRRPYFMSFDPVPDTPLSDRSAVPLWREIRLYQASYLMKDYGMKSADIDLVLDDNGNLLNEDPKMVYAKHNRDIFPLDINEAGYNELLLVPGIGPVTARRIITSRPIENFVQLMNIGVVLKRARPFIKVGKKFQSSLEAFV
ncbi:radical SAM protein [Methanocella sp. CWC-04]|uniref:Radical SAM protein n=1 Tax=Methanooceanicella nereidis TaxID=2052831 RepID=A0AAP2W884_9EURY|nr:helix-hairpin-helix domain-containing protein [Methanocella sp. CWC-04]MCD1295811.1 radical SAM protein [Methanocella sp. CWC-04]